VTYNLREERKNHELRLPFPHQSDALTELDSWFKHDKAPHGALLVLPTGSGKTFIAVRFLCKDPLSAGYKVLWLAHTHHLLDQAFGSFTSEVGLIQEPKTQLNVRVVSGIKKHYKPYDISPEDDVVISTLQTITNAYDMGQQHLEAFLNASKGRLFVIFDEAHHAPAPSYRSLISNKEGTGLSDQWTDMFLLGLTATPTYTDERKRGWLETLFPDGKLYETTVEKLIPSGVLARPRVESPRTHVVPDFDAADYHRWLGSFGDLPDYIIEELAGNKDRNRFIAEYYVQNKDKYGKTLFFADRWYQCLELCEFLKNNSQNKAVRADWIFTHTGGKELQCTDGSVKDHNERVLNAFKNNELDVVVNVRILTEGTDIPDLQTVFLTRQTTSRILLTQMVGRALRGPKATAVVRTNGTTKVVTGTDVAYIVSFIDNWEQAINWAEWDIEEGGAEDKYVDYKKRPPYDLISIERVRQLVRQMDSGVFIEYEPFLTFMPVGWYLVEYYSKIENLSNETLEHDEECADEDSGGEAYIETVHRLVMVYKDERKSYNEKETYDRFIDELTHEDLTLFISEDVTLDERQSILAQWVEAFSFTAISGITEDVMLKLFDIARHMAQNGGDPPQYFSFEERERHNLDAIAQLIIDRDCRDSEEEAYLRRQYDRSDRFWRVIYPSYHLFWSQCMGCKRRIIDEKKGSESGMTTVGSEKVVYPDDDKIPEEFKREVKERDGYACRCCGDYTRSHLQVDHVMPKARTGPINDIDNLQTLCKICNGLKGVSVIDFRNNVTDRTTAPSTFRQMRPPTRNWVRERVSWEQFLRRTINFFYETAAVKSVTAGQRGLGLQNWDIKLYPGNDPQWFNPHRKNLLDIVNSAREQAGLSSRVKHITIH
jgi:ATP-dependent helicase IRC3